MIPIHTVDGRFYWQDGGEKNPPQLCFDIKARIIALLSERKIKARDGNIKPLKPLPKGITIYTKFPEFKSEKDDILHRFYLDKSATRKINIEIVLTRARFKGLFLAF